MQKTINKSVALVLLFLVIISCIPLFLSNELAYKYEFYNYLILEILVFSIPFLLNRRKIDFFLSPSFIAVSYVNINFFIGSYLFANDLVFRKITGDYRLWEFHTQRMLFFNLINFVIILAFFVKFKINTKGFLITDLKKIHKSIFLFITLLCFVLLVIFNPKLSFLGPSDDYSIILKTLFGIMLLVYINKNFKLFSRLFYYFIILSVFVLFSVENKREAIFLILPIVILEKKNIKLTISLKRIIILLTAAIVFFYAIIAMSILRGYGYKEDNFFKALTLVDDYVQADYFAPAIANNLELAQTYLHSNNVIEYLHQDKMDYLYGETFVKPLFIFIPRSRFENKPNSAIDHYTRAYNKSFREKGGSYPVSFQSEFFLNFAWLSLLIAFVSFVFLNGFYYLTLDIIASDDIINYVYLLYGYEIYLSLVRGSGLDLFTVSMIIFLFFFILFKVFMKVLLRSLESKNKP